MIESFSVYNQSTFVPERWQNTLEWNTLLCVKLQYYTEQVWPSSTPQPTHLRHTRKKSHSRETKRRFTFTTKQQFPPSTSAGEERQQCYFNLLTCHTLNLTLPLFQLHSDKMASLSERNLSWPVRCEIFEKPVLLSCCHSFCEGCLKSWWREKQTHQCPLCKRRFSKEEPSLDFALNNLCEAFLRGRDSEARCTLRNLNSSVWAISSQFVKKCRDLKNTHRPEIQTRRRSRIGSQRRAPEISDVLQDKEELLRKLNWSVIKQRNP